jgi:hypothetical protein
MSFLSISNRVNDKNRRKKPATKILLAATGLLCSVLVSNTASTPAASALDIQWTDQSSSLPAPVSQWSPGRLDDVAIGGGKVVVVGSEPSQYVGNNVWTSALDPLSFSGVDIATGIAITDIEFGGGVFLAAGFGPSNSQTAVAFSSADGVTWTNRTSVLPTGIKFDEELEIRYSGGEFIVTGKFTSGGNTTTGITRTANGQTWSTPNIISPNANQTPQLPQNGKSVAVNGSTVLLGGGRNPSGSFSSIAISVNGGSWRFGQGVDNPFTIDGTVATPVFAVVGYGGGKYIGIRDPYTPQRDIFTSVDGFAWTKRTNALATGITPVSIEWTGSEYVLVGNEGIATSSDGITWSQLLIADLNSSVAANGGVVFNFAYSSGLGVLVGVMSNGPVLLTNGRAVLQPSITLSSTSGSATVGSAANSLYTVTNSGDSATFSISPSAPAGMTFSTSTGLLTGTPTAVQSATTYTITATNISGSSSRTFSLTVLAAPVSLTVTASSHTVTVGAAAPTITGSPSVNGVTRTGEICTSTYTASSAAGTYPTSCSGGTAAGYVITYVAGTITANAAVSTTTTVPVVNTAPTGGVAPELVTTSNQQQFEADPGEATAVINGKVVNVVVVKPEATSDPAALLASANKIVGDLEKLLPQGAASPVKVVETAEGASLTGILTSPDDPKQSIPVPVESVTLVKAGSAAMLISALNQTDVPAVLNAGGTIEVTRGGSIAAIAYGLPSAEKGEIVLMSTPRLLGRFTVDASGGYKGQVPLPKDIAFGSHTVVLATTNAKISLGIKLVRTRLEYRIKKKTTPNLFLRRAGIAKSNVTPVKVSGKGRCRANSKQIIFSAKPGRCFITVKQAAVGNNKAIFYRFTVKVVTKPTKRTLKQ